MVRETQVSRRPTHRDIAQLAGTSQATVSLVLTNRDTMVRISKATREAVLAAARRLGYLPDLNARRLGHKSGAAAAPELVIAVLRPAGTPLANASPVIEAAIESLSGLSSAGAAGGTSGADGAVGVAGVPQLVLEEFEPGRLGEHPGLLVGSRFHGAIATSLTPEDEAYVAAQEFQTPVVLFQRRHAQHAYVDVDNVAGGAAVTRHLLERGRRRIAAISYATPPSSAQQQRLEGHRRALEEAGLPVEAGQVRYAEQIDPASGAAAAVSLLAEWRPDAIFALTDPLAVGAAFAVRRAGLRVPEDVAIVGYDDLPYAAFQCPPLSSVRLPYGEMGRAAIEWLAAAARGAAGAPLQRVYQPELIVRDSS